MFLEKLKLDLAKLANKKLGNDLIKPEDFEYPPKGVDADLALPVFKLAKQLKKKPEEIAGDLDLEHKFIKKTETKGAYINFYLNREKVAEEVIKELQNQTVDNNYVDIGKGEKILLEYVSPNSNKPLHLGHIRNAFLGSSLSNILEFCGYNVERSALVNDRGIAICKAMLAYKLWGKGDSPAKSKLKSDHFVGKYYVLFDKNAREDESLNEKAQKLLQKWEKGDKETVDLWKKMQKWVLDGYKETYKKLGISFDSVQYEHKLYKEGRKLVEDYLEKKKFVRDKKGNIIADLSECNLPDKVMLREDGTAIYSTTDLALAKKRLEKGVSKIFYVVGSEQDLYFKQLFCILKMLDLGSGQMKLIKKPEFCHVSYGLVELPEGKMKSREGTVVDADDLINKMEQLIEKEVKARNDFIAQKEADKRTEIIASAALRFYILNVNPATKIKFNPKESINFTGKTGPYLLYSYARLHSIWRKGKEKEIYKGINYALLKEEDWKLIWEISKFPEVIIRAARELDPEEISSYLYELAVKISDFYHKLPVLEAGLPERKLRIAVIDSLLDVMEKGLGLLGIETLEEM